MSQPDDMDAQIAEQERLIEAARAKLDKARLSSGDAGRASNGRFQPGNQIGKGRGNPFAGEVQKRRAALMSAVSVEDVQDIALKLVEMAKRGHIEAIKEVFDRVIGKPLPSDVFQDIANLEAAVAKHIDDWQRDRGGGPMRLVKE